MLITFELQPPVVCFYNSPSFRKNEFWASWFHGPRSAHTKCIKHLKWLLKSNFFLIHDFGTLETLTGFLVCILSGVDIRHQINIPVVEMHAGKLTAPPLNLLSSSLNPDRPYIMKPNWPFNLCPAPHLHGTFPWSRNCPAWDALCLFAFLLSLCWNQEITTCVSTMLLSVWLPYTTVTKPSPY